MKKHLVFPICLLIAACAMWLVLATDPYVFMGSGQREAQIQGQKIEALREMAEANAELLTAARGIYQSVENRILLQGYDGFSLDISYSGHGGEAVIHLLLSKDIEMQQIVSLRDTGLLTEDEKEKVREIAALMQNLELDLIWPDSYHFEWIGQSRLMLSYFETEEGISEYRAQIGNYLHSMKELIPGWYAVIEVIPKG